MVGKNLYTSFDTFELHDIFFDDDLFCNAYDATSLLFENELYKTIKIDNYSHQTLILKVLVKIHGLQISYTLSNSLH